MDKISFEGLLGGLERRAFHDDRSETRRRAALAALFATLPSQSREPGERAIQLETYARHLEDLAPEVLEAVVRAALKSDKLKWLPAIGELRKAAAKIIRRMRYKATGSTPASDYHPEYGVVFNAEREIAWAQRNAEALTAGVVPKALPAGMERHQPVFESVRPALNGGQAAALLEAGEPEERAYGDPSAEVPF